MTSELIPSIQPESPSDGMWDDTSQMPAWYVSGALLLSAVLLLYYFYSQTTLFRKESFLWGQDVSQEEMQPDVETVPCERWDKKQRYWRLRGDMGWELAVSDNPC